MKLSDPVLPKRAKDLIAQNAHTLTQMTKGKQLVPYIGMVGQNNLGDEVLYLAHQQLFPNYQLVPYRKDGMIMQKIGRSIGRPFHPTAILGGGTLINDGEIWIGKTESLLAQHIRIFCIGTGAETSAFSNQKDEANALLKRWVRALEQFAFVGVRGPQSKAVLEKAGAKNIVITGDTALSLTPDKLTKKKSQGIVGITYGDVAGNPMWGDRQEYRKQLAGVIHFLIQNGLKVRLLPVWDIDLPSNRSLLAEINHPDCTMVSAFDSFEHFSAIVQECDFFIGQKLHSTILAVMNRVPVIMIEYRPKCLDFMTSVGLEQYVLKTSELTLPTFTKLYNRLEKETVSLGAKVEAKILEYKHIQQEQAKRLVA